MPPDPEHPQPERRAEGETIDATFRSGSLTAISVLVGFSLSFLTRWAALPGVWLPMDLIALLSIVVGIVCQTTALAGLLSVRSLLLRRYDRAVRIFLTGLALVALGVAAAIGADIVGRGQRTLG